MHPETAYANGWSVRQALDPKAMPAWLWVGHGRCYVWLTDEGEYEQADMTDVACTSLHAPELYREDV
jgi:hypothetical protein